MSNFNEEEGGREEEGGGLLFPPQNQPTSTWKEIHIFAILPYEKLIISISPILTL